MIVFPGIKIHQWNPEQVIIPLEDYFGKIIGTSGGNCIIPVKVRGGKKFMRGRKGMDTAGIKRSLTLFKVGNLLSDFLQILLVFVPYINL